jgi:hypothetical protein
MAAVYQNGDIALQVYPEAYANTQVRTRRRKWYPTTDLCCGKDKPAPPRVALISLYGD